MATPLPAPASAPMLEGGTEDASTAETPAAAQADAAPDAGATAADAGAAPPRAPVPTPTREALVQAVLDALAASDVEALMALTPTREEITQVCGVADGLRPDGRDMLQYAIHSCGGYVPLGSRPKSTSGGKVTGPYATCRAVDKAKFLVVTIPGPPGAPRDVEVRIDEPARVGNRWVILDNPRCSLK